MLKNKKSGKIALQINRHMIIFEIIFILISAVFIFIYNMSYYIEERFESATKLGNYTASELESYEPLRFLVPYWQEHYSQMEFFYDDSQRAAEKEYLLRKKIPEMTEVKYVTPQQAESLDAEGQQLLAEICYYELSESYNRSKSAYSPEFLTGFVVNNNETFFLLSGIKENEARISSGGEVFELGSTSPYVEGVYPILDEILRTGKSPEAMEFSMKKGADKEYVHMFVPVYSNNEPVMFVGVSMQWKDLISNVMNISLLIAFVTSILFIILGVLFLNLLKKNITNPLRDEQHIINEYKENKNAEKTVENLSFISSNNEIQDLAEDFSSMVMEIERHIDQVKSITAEKERIGAELELATKIQASMLPNIFPPFPDRKEFDIYATMTPAKEVGGDFYDFFLIDDDHLGMVMADVSGKGIPAALFMMASKILVNNFALMGGSPAKVLEQTNTTICKNNEQEMFVTVWFGVLEISTGKITAANAGHEYPMIKKADGSFALFRDKHGFVIGGMNGMHYKEYEFTLEKGGTLFLYTDGVAEATNAQNELFGTDRMLDALNIDPQANPKTLLENMKNAVNEFVGNAPQFDDLTMLSIKLL